MNLPSFVDLRSDYDEVYNQGSDNACGAFAISSALDCIFERSTGVKHRFDKNYIWNNSKIVRGIPSYTNIGMDYSSASASLSQYGAKLELKDNQPNTEIIKGFTLVQTSIGSLDSIKEKLALGVPLIYLINVPVSFGNGKDWKKHTIEFNKDFSYGLHYVCVVGYDDVSQRFLFENSWGESWGDGGFFGVPYKDMLNPFFFQGINHIDLAPVAFVGYEGFKMQAYMLNVDKAGFTDRFNPVLKQMLIDELHKTGVQGLINLMIKLGVSDKHLETLQGWERGSVRKFQLENKELNWNGFIWDQM